MRKIIDSELLDLLNSGKSQKEAAKHFNCSEAAVSKRISKLQKRVPESFKKLTKKQQNFALALAEGNSRTDSAEIAYNTSTRESSKTIGKRLAKDSDIQKAVCEILQESGLNRRYRVNRLRELVDSPDDNIALRALDQCWRLDNAYSPETHLIAPVRYEDIVERRQTVEKELEELKRRRAALLANQDENSVLDAEGELTG